MTDRRAELVRLLGGFSASRFVLRNSEPIASAATGSRAFRLDLERADGVRVRGLLSGPAGDWRDSPAVLYCHAHGGRYDIGAAELLDSRPALLPEAYGAALAARGIAALAIDLPCFGLRVTETESMAAKRSLWRGKPLFGEMLEDLAGALTLLSAWPGIAGDRIGAFGISMGATLSFWLAALEPRLRCLAHLCCFADLGELIRLGGHDRHGLYMMVPGLVDRVRTGEIAGLAARRPQLAAMGALDPLTPPSAIAIALADVRAAYAAAGAPDRLDILVDPQVGHCETPEMRRAVLAFLSRHL